MKTPLPLKIRPSGISPRKASENSPRKSSRPSSHKLGSPFEPDDPTFVIASAIVLGKLDSMNSDIEELPDAIGE